MSRPDSAALKDLLLAAPVAGSCWQHRNGTLYYVKCGSIDEETLEVLVTYHDRKDAVPFTRKLSVFMDGRFARKPEFDEPDL